MAEKQNRTALQKISKLFPQWSEEELAIIKTNVAKNTTDNELAYFIGVCSSIDLNPFLKEIWCYKDNKKNLLVFAGRDGFLKKAQQNQNFGGIRSSEVREKDDFSIDIANNEIKNTFGKSERGIIIGAYAIAFRKDGEPTIEYVSFQTYNKGYNTWKTHPAEMIKKVAEVHALKKAFGLSLLQSQEDYNLINDTAYPIDTEYDNYRQVDYAMSLLDNSIYSPEYANELQSEIENKNTSSIRIGEIIEDLKANQKGINEGVLGSETNISKHVKEISGL